MQLVSVADVIECSCHIDSSTRCHCLYRSALTQRPPSCALTFTDCNAWTRLATDVSIARPSRRTQLPACLMYRWRPPRTPGVRDCICVCQLFSIQAACRLLHSSFCSIGHKAVSPSSCLEAGPRSKGSLRSYVRTGRR